MAKEPQKKKSSDINISRQIKFGLRAKIIWLIVILVAIIMLFVYRTILQDQKSAMTNLMITSGGALATLLADNTHVILQNALLEKAGPRGITERTWESIDVFELGLQETIDKIIDQKDIVYAVIVNKYNKVVCHSKTDPAHDAPQNSIFQPLPGIKSYKEIYNSGDPVIPRDQVFSGEFYEPKSKKQITGELLDLSFPMVVDSKVNNLNAYEGEVHIGISKETINKTIHTAEQKLQLVSVLSALFGLLGAIFLAALIISPIKRLVGAMERVTNGDLKQKVKVRTGDEVQVLADSFNRMTEGLGKYVSAGLVKKLMKQEGLSLGGSYKKLTMMESDIRNFTGTSEKMSPEEVVSYLNDYLDNMTKIIMKYGGEVDKYIGDAIVAHFGLFDPLDANLPEHTRNAVRAAVAMNQAMIPFNEERQSKGLGIVRMGVGINTGDVILGNMGSTERMDYTVIGDNMNLTARLCDNAGKDYKEENGNIVHLRNILITEATYEIVRDIAVVEDKIIHIRVKGKEKPVKILQVYDVKG